MRIKLFASLLALPLLAAAFAAPAQESTPVGRWKTFDDKTGKQMTVTEIYAAKNGTYAAKIVETVGMAPNCDECSGKDKGKPVVGMHTLWNLKPKGTGTWGDGNGFKPSEGMNFTAKSVKLVDGGKKLEVTGCKFVFCRTQTWVRE
ncbi:MAG TPA: DUF2147 domain-containing protein [Lysobacter sp.]|nr:DUF2147 domain-containing protein [Lysobacter sp.]